MFRFDETSAKWFFNGTPYNTKVENDVYIIGEKKIDGLQVTEMVRLENRTIESVQDAIPKNLTEDIEIKEFPELNGLILTGAERKVASLKQFISTVDVIVPMVQIDVMLLQSGKSSSIQTGISAGIKDAPNNYFRAGSSGHRCSVRRSVY